MHDQACGVHGKGISQKRILAVLMLSVYMTSVGVSVLNVALPSVETGLGASNAQLQWVLSGYALTFGVALVPAGRAGDLYGRRLLFVFGTLMFAVSCAVAGLATNATMLATARLFQGLAAGISGPQGIGLMQQYFHGGARGKAFGWFGTTIGVAFISGPILGGLIIHLGGDGSGWRWIFLVNIPAAVLAALGALRWIPTEAVKGDRANGRSIDLDIPGTLLVTTAMFVILLPFTIAHQNALWWLLIPFGASVGWGWYRWEIYYRDSGRQPMVELSLFRIKQFTHGVLISSLYLLGTTNVWVLVALYMQDGLGYSALASGMMALPSAGMTILASRAVGRYVYRFGRWFVIIGLTSLLVGMAASIAVVQLHQHIATSEWWLLATLAFVGVAQGSVILPTQTLTLDVIPIDYAGSSAGVMQTGQRIGAAIGITLITAIAFAVLSTSDWTMAATVGFASVGVVIACTLPLAIIDLRAAQKGIFVS